MSFDYNSIPVGFYDEVLGSHEDLTAEWVVEDLHAHVRDRPALPEDAVAILGADRRHVDIGKIGIVETDLAHEARAS